MINLDQSIEKIKVEIGKTPKVEVTRDFLVGIGLREKEGQGRSTLLGWLREEVKAMDSKGAEASYEVTGVTDIPYDAPGEPPLGYEAPALVEEEVDDTPDVPGTVPESLMQEVDSRSCSFPFQSMDVNLNPVCVIHNSGICFPCSREKPPVKRCRVVCFAETPKHRAIKQPKTILKERVIEGNPAAVEMVDASEFDEQD